MSGKRLALIAAACAFLLCASSASAMCGLPRDYGGAPPPPPIPPPPPPPSGLPAGVPYGVHVPNNYAIKDAVSSVRSYEEKSKSPSDTGSTRSNSTDKSRDPNYDKNSRFADANGWGGPATVGWSYSIEDAKKLAQSSSSAYAIYFCSEAAAKTAGEGPQVIDAYKAANNGANPVTTIFDSATVLGQFKDSGISVFVKIPASTENTKLMQSFAAVPNMLVIAAPDGQKLWSVSGSECTMAAVISFLATEFPNKMASWRQTQQGKSDLAALKAGAKTDGNSPIQPLNDPLLPNAFRFSKNLLSGARPENDAGIQALKRLDVKTIICVDADPPETDIADRLGIMTVHLPISFRELPAKRALELAKAVRDLPGPIYVECNSGKHRSVPAAAVASILLGEMTPQQGALALQAAGTSTGYPGMYAAVQSAAKVSKETLDGLTVNFTARAEVPRLPKTMVEIEKTWRRIEMAQSLNWKVPDTRKDLKVDDDLLHMIDLFMQASEWDEMNDPETFKILAECEKCLAATRHAWKKDAKAAGREDELNASFKGALNSCLNCHAMKNAKH